MPSDALNPTTLPTLESLPSIETLTDDVVWVEHVRRLDAGATVSLGAGFADPDILAADVAELFNLRLTTEPIRTFRMHDVALDASLMALYRGALPIPETLYMVSEVDFGYALVKPRLLEPTDPDDHTIVACNRSYRNYYHWIVQALPAIDHGLRNRKQPRVTLALPALRPWHQETLALLGYAEVPRLTLHPDANYALASAEFSELLGWRMSGIVSYAAASTYARLRAAVPAAADGAGEIYVARTDARNRPVANEAALIALLEQRGVRIVVPGTLSVAQQIAMFRQARLVIGPHGAGLTNIAFCEPGGHVYELIPSHYPNICFNRLAQSMGLNYWADVFASDDGPDVQNRPWRVDLDVVAARLDVIRAHIAATTPAASAMEHLRRHAVQLDAAPAEPATASGGLLRRWGTAMARATGFGRR